MINIAKPTAIPVKLLSQGTASNDKILLAYTLDPLIYSGKKGADIKNAIYGHKTVKNILRNAQHGKCCFCERSQLGEAGQVEHYRPKNGYKTTKKGPLVKPGYYWLGYSWNNLYFVCFLCNSVMYKGNLFPLSDESKRAISHLHDITAEDPLLLDPGGIKNPRDHIYFVGELPNWKTKYGRNTISICGLDRVELNDERRLLISDIDARIAILSERHVHSKDDVQKAVKYIQDAVKPTAKFSAMAYDHISKKIPLI
jgi:uncharacterized protein (TIGR02646 family)